MYSYTDKSYLKNKHDINIAMIHSQFTYSAETSIHTYSI